MTRFNHSILFFFGISLALLCSSATMLYLDSVWADAQFATLVTVALLLSLLVPGAAALASRRFVKWRQPLTAWLVFYLIAALLTLIFSRSLLG